MLMLLRLKQLLRLLILPPSGPIGVAVLGVLLLRRHPRLARVCLALGLGSLWLLSTPLVANALGRLASAYPAVDLTSAADARAIVILGGGGQREFAPEYAGPAADPLALERLSYGAYLAHKTGLPVLVTGFQIEARAMRATLERNFDVTPRWVDEDAFDTFQNATNSARLLKADNVSRVILVTHATHMRRAVQEFTAAGIGVVPAPVGMRVPAVLGLLTVMPNPDALLRSDAALYELLGEPVRWFLSATHVRRH
jgi:uncharacterized SAM-binding protein YcdF (DUF218 family)